MSERPNLTTNVQDSAWVPGQGPLGRRQAMLFSHTLCSHRERLNEERGPVQAWPHANKQLGPRSLGGEASQYCQDQDANLHLADNVPAK